MSETIQDIEAKIQYLTTKCNRQVDALLKQERSLQEKEKELENYRKITKKNQERKPFEKDGITNNFTIIFEIFQRAVTRAVQEDAFFKTQKSTKNNVRYQIIEFRKFSGYTEEYTKEFPVSKIMKLWAEIGLLYTDKNGNYGVSYTDAGKSIRSVRIPRLLINLVKECMIHE